MPYKRTPSATASGVGTLSTLDVGTGDDQGMYYSTFPGQLAKVERGTAAAPVTTPDGPVLKASTIQEVTRAALTAAMSANADGVEALSAICGMAVGTALTEVQPVGVFGGAKTSSSAGAAGYNDATGIYGIGRVLTGGTGSGIGGFFSGRRDGNTGRANAAEFHCHNGGSAAAYITGGFTPAQGIWVNAAGDADSAAGIILSNGFGQQFEVGLAFNAQVSNSKTGPTRVNDIRSDSVATTSLLIQGTHSTAAIAVANGSGKVGIGLTSPTSLLHVDGGDAEVSGSTKGVILTSANATRWRITVDDTGHLVTTAL